MNINESFHFVENQNFETNLRKTKIVQIDYPLESFHRSNQDTTLLHKPAVFEGQWVESGDLLADCSTSVGGDLSLGQNLLIGYMPWEGYNFEDAILISERLVYDDLYTSVHIEKYEVEFENCVTGFLMMPEPMECPCRVQEITTLMGKIKCLYNEIIPSVGTFSPGFIKI